MLVTKIVIAVAGIGCTVAGFVAGERRAWLSLLAPLGVLMLLVAMVWIAVPAFFD